MSPLGNNIEIVCLESEALKALVIRVSESIQKDIKPFIDEKEAMHLLSITSKTTFRKYRDEHNLDHRYVSQKHILYRRQSIIDFIDSRKPSKT